MRRGGLGRRVSRRGLRRFEESTAYAAGVAILPLLACGLWGAPAGAQCTGPSVELISQATNGDQAQGRSELPAVSADGCVVAFKSSAPNLVPGGGNQRVDVFRRDRSSGLTERIPPQAATGSNPDANSFPPALDAIGRFVAFGSLASNLVRGDSNGEPDLFVYDHVLAQTDILTLIFDPHTQLASGGQVPDLAPGISGDGCVVAFSSDAALTGNDNNELTDVFVHVATRNVSTGECDRSTATVELISEVTFGTDNGHSPSSGSSVGATLSADGCAVAFYSSAHLTPDDPEGTCDVFVRNRCTMEPPERIGQVSNGPCSETPHFLPAISADGRFVAFATDVAFDGGNIYLRDRKYATSFRISNAVGGAAPDGPSQFPSLSGDGRFLVFQSSATNLVQGDTNRTSDIFVVEVDTDQDIAHPAARISIASDGSEATGDSLAPQISADGSTVVFQSYAQNLVTDDTNGDSDIFAVANPLNLSPTPTTTPVPTVTPTAELTSTATPSSTVTPSSTPSVTATPRSTGSVTVTPSAVPSGTASPTATRTATATPTAGRSETATPTRSSGTATPTKGAEQPTAAISHGGGGGCSCRIDAASSASSYGNVLLAIGAPLLVLVLRRRLRSRNTA